MRVPKVLPQEGFNHPGRIQNIPESKKLSDNRSAKNIDNSNRLFKVNISGISGFVKKNLGRVA